jgi:hypothetical protein
MCFGKHGYPKSCEKPNFGAYAIIVRDMADELAGHMRAVVDLRASLDPFESEATAELIFERQLLPTLINVCVLWGNTKHSWVSDLTNPFIQGVFHHFPPN